MTLLHATRIKGHRTQTAAYICGRCGIEKESGTGRLNRFCRDCRDVDPAMCTTQPTGKAPR